MNGKGGSYGVTGTATGSGTGVSGMSTSGNGVTGGSGSSSPSGSGYGYGGAFDSIHSLGLTLDPASQGPYTNQNSGFGSLVIYGRVPSTEGGENELLFSVLGCYEIHTNPINTCEPSYQLYADGSESASAVRTDAIYVRTKRSAGADVASYGARSASPTLEDFGRSMLRGGSAYVALDPVFASTIDTRGYMVFITPEGESHGLYTTRLAANGFEVRENAGGRSSLSFSYRIVAHPLDAAGVAGAHLPLMASKVPVTRSFGARLRR